MALLDQLHRMEQQVQRRLRELEPLVNEYHELQKVAQRLGISHSDGKTTASPAGHSRVAATGRGATAGATKTSRTRRATTGRGTRRRRTAASPGSRQQEVLRLVNQRPGITVPELGKELGVDPTGLYQIVRRLESRGQIRKDGRQLQPLAAAPQDASADGAGAAAS
jgi:Winged helix-turn-helix DNA-binding